MSRRSHVAVVVAASILALGLCPSQAMGAGWEGAEGSGWASSLWSEIRSLWSGAARGLDWSRREISSERPEGRRAIGEAGCGYDPNGKCQSVEVEVEAGCGYDPNGLRCGS